MNDIEEWRAIKGYEGIYEVSDHGRVRSLDREDCRKQKRIGKILHPGQDKKKGYLNVGLCKNGVRDQRNVHTLVASAFLGDCPDGMEVGHKDHDGSNNALGNIEYVTHPENMAHAARNGRMLRGLSVEEVQDIREIVADNMRTSRTELAEILGVSRSTISSVIGARTSKLIPNKDGTQPAKLKTTLTLEDITSLQAQGYTLPEIGKYYGVHYSTPYQIIGRAKRRGVFLE